LPESRGKANASTKHTRCITSAPPKISRTQPFKAIPLASDFKMKNLPRIIQNLKIENTKITKYNIAQMQKHKVKNQSAYT